MMKSLFPSKFLTTKKAKILTILCPAVVPARFSRQSSSADCLIPASVTLSFSVKFKTIMAYYKRLSFSFLIFIKDVLDSEFSHVLKDGLLVTLHQQVEEIFCIHMYEISFIICIVVSGLKGYSMWNNKIQ